MAKLIDNLSWIQDGEKANADVFNRPLKELIGLIDNKEFEILSKTSGMKVDSSEVDTDVQQGDFVYRGQDGIYYQASGADDTTNNVIGYYDIVDNVPSIIWSGLFSSKDLETGKIYYLSDSVSGSITDVNYSGAKQIGTALSDTQLLVSSLGGSSSGGSTPVDLNGVTILDNATDGDFVYRTISGEIGLAVVDGTDRENVVGILKSNSGRNSIVYNGIVDGFTGLEVGSYYYLSPSEPGKIQLDSYPGAIKVGIANSDTELLVDIDKAPSSNDDEELEYQLLLNNSSFKQAYFNVFTELNTMKENNNDDSSNIVYSALNTSYTVSNAANVSLETPVNLLGDGNNTTYYSFQIASDIVGNATTEYSIDDGKTYSEIPEDGYIKIKAGTTNFKLRFIAVDDTIEIKSFGVLFEEEGFIGTNRIKLREHMTATEDIAAGTEVDIPNGQYYTMNGQSLNIRYEGLALIPGVDYTEVTNRSVKFNADIRKGDTVEFEEIYGYVDLSEDNIARVDQNIIDIEALREKTTTWSNIFTADGGEKTITIPDSKTYTPGAGEMLVILEGKIQYIGSDYTEASETTIELSNALNEGDQVMFQKV